MTMLRTGILVLGFLMASIAQSQSIEFNNITIEQNTDHWQVTPHYDITLSEAMIEAIHNGIEIIFVSEVQLIAEKNWWPDETLLREVKRFEIHYFSLSSQYQLKLIGESKSATFMTLDALLTQLSRKTAFSLDKKPTATAVESHFYLDKRALPSTMQLPILFDPQWSLKARPFRQALPDTDNP